MKELVENAELIAFTQTVDSKSLSRAAAELGLPRATLGRRLARLEERLGTRLLQRTTRSLSLTRSGETFYRHARIVLDAVTQAENSISDARGVIAGDLRVSIPPISDPAFLRMLTTFAQTYPAVRLQVHSSSRHVDIRREGYDVAIRAGLQNEPGLVARVLSRSKLIAVAAPAYLKKWGVPQRKGDLSKHRCLMGFARGELPQTHWPIAGASVHMEGVFSSNDVQLLREAAIQGLGIALLPRIIIEDALTNGSLVHVLPDIVGSETRIAVVHPERDFTPPHVRAFVDAVVLWGQGFRNDAKNARARIRDKT